MDVNSIIITPDLREMINSYVGRELIPSCAVGKYIIFHNGNIFFETFEKDDMSGARMLTKEGEIINLIQERGAKKLHLITLPN